MQIVIYCPDRHISYDGSLPDRTGVGGGLTFRIRIAAALARRGHAVSVIGNCPRQSVHQRVRYIPLQAAPRIACEVLIMHSSGGALDLSPLRAVDIQANLRVLALSGTGLPAGADQLSPDAIYACSNFVRTAVLHAGVPGEKIFVSYHGVNRWNKQGLLGPVRDPHRLMYSSHPSKGLNPALEVARLLRESDSRFRLHCFGGHRLWGGPEQPPAADPAVKYGGLLNQRQLATEYKRSGFVLQLQTRLEPFGLTVVEAMAAGCLVVASPVGSFPELIRHGETGFLIEGDPSDAATVERAVNLIRAVSSNPDLMRRIRRNAAQTVLDWGAVAKVWEAHFHWLLCREKAKTLEAAWARCPECGARCLALADGYHCSACGRFGRDCRSELKAES